MWMHRPDRRPTVLTTAIIVPMVIMSILLSGTNIKNALGNTNYQRIFVTGWVWSPVQQRSHLYPPRVQSSNTKHHSSSISIYPSCYANLKQTQQQHQRLYSSSENGTPSTETTSVSLLTPLPSTPFDDGQRPFQITTPIYYVNDKPHIGHAYTSTGT